MSDWEFLVKYLKMADLVPSHCSVKNVIGLIRDGSVLCRLLNFLKPLSVDSKMISANPRNSRFLSSKNVHVFLDVCKTSFGLEQEYLFQASDLLNGEDLEKVHKTLTNLLCNEAAQKKLRSLEGTKRSPMPLPAEDEHYYTNPEDDKIYYRAIDLLPQMQTLKMEKKDPKQQCISELIHTEKKYTQILELLLKKYKACLSTFLTPADMDFIFSLIEKMHGIHTEFYASMIDTLEVDSRMAIAECFISNKEKFLVYGEYCSNVADVQARIDELLAHPGIKNAVEECQKSCAVVDIKFRDLFIVPMQRILKYPLFIKNCIENTSDDNQTEKKILSKALEEIEDLAQYVNEVKRDRENIGNIDRIERSIKDIHSCLRQGTHLRNYGRLLKDGEVKCKTLNKLCMLFLFDRLLLICLRIKENDMLQLNKYIVIQHSNLVTKQKSERCFALLNDQGITEFKTKTAEERDEWIAKLIAAKETACPTIPWNNNIPPPKLSICTFKEITICDVCKKLLKGVFFQGYSCPNPRLNVHKECIPKLQYQDILTIPDKLHSPTDTTPSSLTGAPWYAGNIDRSTAELLLNGTPNGTFLVRKKGPGYAITLKYGEVFHMLVTEINGQFALGSSKLFPRIQDLVQFYQERSLDKLYSSLQTKLVYPYKRL